MARPASILIPTQTEGSGSGPTDWVISLNGSAASSQILLGKNAIFVIQFNPTAAPTAPAGMGITFGLGTSGSFVTPTSSNCYQIPASQQTTFDLGQANDTIQLIAGVAGTAYIKLLSVV